jgi:LysR family transcriptional regulator, glycine cleavage system transcriptional activator
MTQAAVSYQIKLLEERLGAALFLRRPRALALTEAGQWLAPRTSDAFDLLRDAFARFSERAQSTLVINTMHTFAAQWLAPRLGAYQLGQPRTAIQLETTARLVDFARDEVDVVIRSGKGKWPGLLAYKLIDVRYTLMLSPALLNKIGGMRKPEDLLKVDLIDTGDPWWTEWFAAIGQPIKTLPPPNVAMGLQTITASAAMAGGGAALLIPAFFEQEVADNKLVAPFDLIVDEGDAYWLAFPENRRNVPKIRSFRDWILGEIAGAANSESAG